MALDILIRNNQQICFPNIYFTANDNSVKTKKLDSKLFTIFI